MMGSIVHPITAGIVSGGGGASFDGIILDTFVDADTTNITAHTPDTDTVVAS